MNTLPNKITLCRIVLIPVFMLLAYQGFMLAAFLVYIIACLSDMADGYIARKYNQISNFGKFMDPLADKMLVLSAMCFFIESGQMPGWAVAIVLFREFAVSSIRLLAATDGKVVAANIWGKVKTVSQIIAIILIFVLQIFLEILNMGFVSVGSNIVEFCAFVFNIIGNVALWISTIICVISGVIYIWDNRKFISEK